MTAQLPSKVRLAQIASFTKSMALPPSHDEIEAMAHALLAAHEQEPVGEVIEMCGGLIMDGVINLDNRSYREISGINKMKRMLLGTKFYSRPAPVPAVPDDTRRMDWLVSKTVNVREPMVYGSHDLFWSQTISDDWDEEHKTTLREQIDAAMLNGGKS